MNKCIIALCIIVSLFSCKESLNVMDPEFDVRNYDLIDSTEIPNSNVGAKLLFNQTLNKQFTDRVWQGIPSIGIDAKENLYVAWYSGSKGEGVGNFVTLSISKDKGKTWEHDRLIVNPSYNNRVFDPCLFSDKYSNLYLAWTKGNLSKLDPERYDTWYSKITLDDNDSLKASFPKRLAAGIMLNKPVTVKSESEMLFPIAYWLFRDSTNQQPWLYSAKYLRSSLSVIQKVAFIPVINSLRSYDEHMVVELNTGGYLAMIRCTDGIYFSKSIDGIIWSNVKKLTQLGETTSSRFFLGKSQTGDLILVMNSNKLRTNMKAFISKDDGQSWNESYLLDNRSNISYPDLVEDKKGNLYIVFDYDRYGKGEISLSIIENNQLDNSKRVLPVKSIHKLRP